MSAESEIKAASLYAKMPEHRALVRRTERFIAECLEQVQNPYLSCSFGKDSSVMLHLVLQQRPDIVVKFLGKKETTLIDDYDAVIAWWQDRYQTMRLEKIIYVGWLEDRTAKTGIKQNINDDGYDAFFVGIRRDESVPRRMTLGKHGVFYRNSDGKYRIAPLADWKTRDVAAYMVFHGLPILRAYKREGFSARTTSNIPSKFPQESIARLKDADPAAYNQLIQQFPDARFFT